MFTTDQQFTNMKTQQRHGSAHEFLNSVSCTYEHCLLWDPPVTELLSSHFAWNFYCAHDSGVHKLHNQKKKSNVSQVGRVVNYQVVIYPYLRDAILTKWDAQSRIPTLVQWGSLAEAIRSLIGPSPSKRVVLVLNTQTLVVVPNYQSCSFIARDQHLKC